MSINGNQKGFTNVFKSDLIIFMSFIFLVSSQLLLEKKEFEYVKRLQEEEEERSKMPVC